MANVVREIEEILSSVKDRVFDERVIQEDNTEEARKKTPQKPAKGNARPQKTIAASTQYAKDPELIAWVLEDAGGRCELCSKKAPFIKISGYPFLKVYQSKHLAFEDRTSFQTLLHSVSIVIESFMWNGIKSKQVATLL